jgi:hypothetical protein
MSEEDTTDTPEVEDTPPTDMTEQQRGRPRKRRMRRSSFYQYITFGAFIAWVSFLMIWLFFFAGSYDIFQNIGVAVASFFVAGGVLSLLVIPPGSGPTGSSIPIKASILSLVAWIVFMAIWLPFYAPSGLIYQNIVIFIIACLLFLLFNVLVWGRTMKAEMGFRPYASMGIFGGWMAFLIIWLWFFALGYTGYQNIAITMVSFLVGMLFIYLLWRSEIERGKGEIQGGGLFVIWFLVLAAWFWFLADGFDVYQNLAIIILSLFIFTGIGYFLGKNRWGSIKNLDWDE